MTWTSQVARQVIVDGSGSDTGVFVYDGVPASGNLIVSIAAESGTDQYGNNYPQGLYVAAGVIEGASFEGSDFIINNAGAYFYSGAPGAGDLVASIVSADGFDPFGNLVLQGITVYGPDTSGIQLLPGDVPQVVMYPGNANIPLQFPNLFASIAGPGTTAERYAWNLTSGYPSAGTDYQTSIFGQGAAGDGSADGFIDLVVASKEGDLYGVDITPQSAVFAMPVLATVPGEAIAETWHPGALIDGWINQGGSNVAFAYRMTPFNEVEIIGVINGDSATSSKFFTLPSDYWPSAQQPACDAVNTSWVTGFVQCDTSGNLTIQAAAYKLSDPWVFHGFISRDV